mmetsp:Transcript_1129/g.2431  ORF Transcript_1129/g.2431 Transcript_1129/m.2431 type:complete len:220 (-) Transcript_1129:781-1440(-)
MRFVCVSRKSKAVSTPRPAAAKAAHADCTASQTARVIAKSAARSQTAPRCPATSAQELPSCRSCIWFSFRRAASFSGLASLLSRSSPPSRRPGPRAWGARFRPGNRRRSRPPGGYWAPRRAFYQRFGPPAHRPRAARPASSSSPPPAWSEPSLCSGRTGTPAVWCFWRCLWGTGRPWKVRGAAAASSRDRPGSGYPCTRWQTRCRAARACCLCRQRIPR